MSDVTDAADRLERLQRDARKRTPYDRVMRLPEEDIDIVIAAARKVDALDSDHTESEKSLIDSLSDVLDERDALAAVIEKALAVEVFLIPMSEAIDEISRILRTVNTAEILRERDAAVWEEGFVEAQNRAPEDDWGNTWHEAVNPYRNEAGE